MAGSLVTGTEQYLHSTHTKQSSPNNTTEMAPQKKSPLICSTGSPDTPAKMDLDTDILLSDTVSNHNDDDQDGDLPEGDLNLSSPNPSSPVKSEGSDGGSRSRAGSDAKSTTSASGSMSSSTYEHEQERFDTYKFKVIQLCLDIGYGEPVEVERMEGGSFNRIIGLAFESPEKKRCVLRIPRNPYDETQPHEISDQVSILLYLSQFDFLKVPSILAFDTTTNNVIKSQWVLQARLPGKQIQDVYYQLPFADKLQIAGEVAHLTSKMSNIKLAKPGQLIGTRSLPPFSHVPPAAEEMIDFTGFKFTSDLLHQEQTLTSFLVGLFNHFKSKDLAYSHPIPGATERMVARWDKLGLIATQMEKAGLMRKQDNENVLWHWDICARNVLIEQVGGVDEQAAKAEVSSGKGTLLENGIAGTSQSTVPAQIDGKLSCHHSVQFSVEDTPDNGHKHTVQVKVEDSSGKKCGHKIEVSVEDSLGKTYRHTLQISDRNPSRNPDEQQTTSAVLLDDEAQVASQQPPSEWVVSGVLDWDEALSVPLVLSRVQHSWLWCDEEERSSHWLYDRDTKPQRELTSDELLIKAHFDQTVARECPDYLEDAYGRGVWLRRLARFAIYGFSDTADFVRYEQFVVDWNDHFESLGLETDNDDGIVESA